MSAARSPTTSRAHTPRAPRAKPPILRSLPVGTPVVSEVEASFLTPATPATPTTPDALLGNPLAGLALADECVRRDAVGAVALQASALPRLPYAQVCALARTAQDSRASEAQRRAARNTLVEGHLLFVVGIAQRYKRAALRQGLSLDDLVSEGVLGLMHAVRKFNPDSGYQFMTYAKWWVTQAITRYLSHAGHALSFPQWAADLALRLTRLVARCEDTGAPLPAQVQVSSGKWVATEEALALVARMPRGRAISLDAPTTLARHGRRGSRDVLATVADEIADPATLPGGDEAPEVVASNTADADALLARAARVCTPQEVRVLRLVVMEDRTLAAAAAVLGLTRQRVNQLRDDALAKLRRAWGAPPTEADARVAARQQAHNAASRLASARQYAAKQANKQAATQADSSNGKRAVM